MLKTEGINREAAKLAITPRLEHDRELARELKKSILAKVRAAIPGAYTTISWRNGKPYYYLYKTYYHQGHLIPKCLLYYGIRPPRGAK